MTKAQCENCQNEFECGIDETICWCQKLPVANSIPKSFKKCLCPKCLSLYIQKPSAPAIEGQDFYWEGSTMVFTAAYHLKRGYCCHSSETGCRHCPYR